jgi:hypothetical protein
MASGKAEVELQVREKGCREESTCGPFQGLDKFESAGNFRFCAVDCVQ